MADTNYKDNEVVSPGQSFEKKWVIKNTGSTTWTTDYALVPIDYGGFKGPELISIPKEVKSGENVELSANLTAPEKEGTYTAYFRLRNANGQFFKLDDTGDLWVKLVVGTPTESSGSMSPSEESTPTGTPNP